MMWHSAKSRFSLVCLFILFSLFSAPNLLPLAQPATTATPRPTIAATGNPLNNAILLVMTDLSVSAACPIDLAQALETQLEATVAQMSGVTYDRLHTAISDEATAQQLVQSQNAVIVIWGTCEQNTVKLNYSLNIQQLDWLARLDQEMPDSPRGRLKSISGMATRLLTSWIDDAQEIDYALKFVAAQLAYFQTAYDVALNDMNATIRLGEQIAGRMLGNAQPLQLDSAYFFRGFIYQETQDKAREALSDYDRAIQINPQNAYAYSNRGTVKHARGETQAALQDYNRAIERDPQLAPAYYNRGDIENELGQFDAAVIDYTRAIELYPQYDSAYNNRGIIKHNRGDYYGALDDYTSAIQSNSLNQYAYNNRAITKSTLNDEPGALADYDRAIEISPNYYVAYTNRGNSKRSLGDYPGATADYDRALQINPQYAPAYFNRGNAKFEIGNYRGAIDDYTLAIQYNPRYAKAYSNRGNAKQLLRDYQGAVQDYSHAVQLDPQFAEAYYNRGIANDELGDMQSALADYTRAIEINPRYVAAYINRGQIKRKLFDKQGALDDFSRAIEINPYVPLAYFARAGTHLDYSEFEEAVADYTRAIDLDPQYANAYFNRGFAYKNMENYAAALADFQTYLKLVPFDANAQEQIADILSFMTPPPYYASPTRISPAFRPSPTFAPTRTNRLTATLTPSRTPTATSTPGPSPTYTATVTPLAAGLPVVMAALWKSGTCSTASEISWKKQLETTVKTVTGGNFIALTEIAEDEAEARQLMQKYGAVVVIWGECELAALDLNLIVDVQRLDVMTRASWQSTHAAEGHIKDVQLAFPPILKIKLKGHFTVVYGMNYILAYLTYLSQDFTTNLQALDAGIEAGEQAAGNNKAALELQLETGYFMRAYIFQTVQNLPEWAINEYNRALQVNPQAAYFYANRGIAKQMLGDMQGAFGDYTTAIQLDPRLAQAYFNRGLAYQATGDVASALADFRTYVELVPDDPRGSAAIAEAEALLNSASTLQPSSTP